MILDLNNYPWMLTERWMSSPETDYWLIRLFDDLVWEQPIIKLFGSSNVIPRKTCFLAEEEITYTYSGVSHTATRWPEWFLPMVRRVNSSVEHSFNGCLLNLYKNGNDRMGWHSDNEPDLDLSKSIASLSLGETRDFSFKHRTKSHRIIFPLNDGDLLVMHPACQEEWLHSLPSRKRVQGLRINLTFRCYRN